MDSPKLNVRWFCLSTAAAIALAILLLLGFNQIPLQAGVAAAVSPSPSSPTAQTLIAPAQADAGDQPWIDYAPGVALVKVKQGVALTSGPANGAVAGANVQSLQGLLGALNTTSITPIFPTTVGLAAAHAGAADSVGLNRIYRLQWTADIPVEQAVAVLTGDPNVEYAEPDYLARPARTPSDPEYAGQWALPQINAPAAWDATTGSPAIVLAIVDSGVDMAHPEFGGRLWVNPGEIPGNGIDDDLNGKIDDINGWSVVKNSGDLADLNGHGTQVGGVAGAAADNGLGVAGICWQCPLMFVNAMQAGNVANYSDIAAAVQYASSNGAEVINLSLGGYADSAVLHDAVKEASTRAVVVAGAGNDDSAAPFYPAAYPEVIAVAATDSSDQKALFSNYGAWVDVSAPGKDIRTTTLGAYATDSGTSLATPFVSGLAGLIWSQHPTWTPEQVKWQILNTAANIDAVNPARAGQVGKGRIAAGAALATNPQPAAVVESYAVDGQPAARPAPGQSLQLAISLRNLWLPAQGLQGVLSSSDPYVSITDNAGSFGDIAPGQLGGNSGDPFGVTIAGSAPYNRVLAFSLTLSGAGGYSLVVPFNVQVRSAVETLGNTIYTQNTTWTSDKTYILNGTVIVNPGVTLSIQPGTVVKGNPGKFIRIDGTLIARGGADQPILFTTNSITTTTWSGLRFTENAVNASYDAAGNYIAGSIVQYATLSYADIGIDLGTRAPYIADSSFGNNGVSIQIGSNSNGGAPMIERSTFSGGGAIQLNGGRPLIRQNRFIGGSSAIGGSGSPQILQNIIRDNTAYMGAIYINGTPVVVSNVIQNNAGGALGMWGSYAPVIHDNVIVGNGGGISAWGQQSVDIEHNLIAGNGGNTSGTPCPPPCSGGGSALALDVQSTGTNQASPALAYNADRNEYLAAWVEAAAPPASIRVLRLGAEGQPLDGGQGLSGGGDAYQVQVVYQPARQRYLVVWAGMGGVHGNFVSADGQVVGELFAVYESTNSSPVDGVRVVHQPADDIFLIAYRLSNGNGAVQRVTADGALAGGPVAVDFTLDSQAFDMAADAGTGKSLLVFQSLYWGSRVWGAWIEPSTQTISPTVLYEDPQWRPVRRPAAAFGPGANRYAVVWEQVLDFSAGYDPHGLMVQPIAADGALPVGPTRILSDTGQPVAPRVAYGSADQFLVVWPYQYSLPGWATTVTQISGQRIDAGGDAVGAPILVSTAMTPANGISASKSQIAVAYNTQYGEYLVAWSDTRTGSGAIWAQRLSSTGQLLDNTWTPADETNPANNFRISATRGVRFNTIIDNAGYGIQLSGAAAGSVSINHNNLFGNGGYELYLAGGTAGSQNFTVDAANNFWNVDASQIPGRIRDCTFDGNGCGYPSSTLGRVAYAPPLPAPDQTAPPFVRSAALAPNPVGIQRGTVTIDFSAPMATTAPPAASFHDARRGTTQNFTFPAGYMAKDPQGRVWVAGSPMMTPGTSPLLVMYNGRQWITYTLPSGVGTSGISALYAANNGDLWVGRTCCSDSRINRLRGTSWTTYTQQLNGGVYLNDVATIGEDGSGNIWIGDNAGAVRFDGSSWRRYTTADGLVDNQVRQIVRDSLGRLWFLAGFGNTGGLSVFDGTTWRTFDHTDGLPQVMDLGPIFADSSGRIWASVSGPSFADKNVGMFDGSRWRYFGSAETGGALYSRVSAFAENRAGAVWMFMNNGGLANPAIYQDGTWSRGPSVGSTYGSLLFDAYDNLWFGSSDLSVRWGGKDYPFVDGKWLSPTRFEAAYDFTAEVLPGQYKVQADGAVGADGIAAYASSSDSFTVDFGVLISLDPPLPPAVTALTDGTLNNISATWRTSTPHVDEYRYAIGTTPGARNLVGWTYLAATSFARSDLPLAAGQRYYVTVQARNSSGLWSIDGLSNPIVGGQTSPPTPDGQQHLYLPAVRR